MFPFASVFRSFEAIDVIAKDDGILTSLNAFKSAGVTIFVSFTHAIASADVANCAIPSVVFVADAGGVPTACVFHCPIAVS